MKILIIAPQPFFSIRGTPMAVKEIVTAFTKFGHKVDMLTFHLGIDVPLSGLTIYRNKLFSKTIKNIPPGYSIQKLILDLVLFIKALPMIFKNRYDIVHCIEESAYLLCFVKFLKRILFVFDMDSDIPKQLVYSGKIKNSFPIGFVKKIEKFTIKASDAVVTICPLFSEKVRSISPRKPVFQIEDTSVSDTIAQHEKHGEDVNILYTGNFESYQGVELLLESFCKIHDKHLNARLVIVGGEQDGIEFLGNKYKNIRIVFTGKKPISEMPKFLEESDILVSPRTEGENTPFKIYSYLASGRPILATDIISHSQILTNGENALLVEPAIDAFALGLDRLLSDKSLAERLGMAAKKLFLENYTKECYLCKVKGYLDFMEDKLCRKKK